MKLKNILLEVDFDLDLLDNSLLKEVGRGVRNYFDVYTPQDIDDAPDVVLELILEILEGIDVDLDYDKLMSLPQESLIKKLLTIHDRKDSLDDLRLGRLVIDVLS